MKYHYFHGRFTYSVKRSGPPRAGRPAPVPLRSVSILELKRERVVRVTRLRAPTVDTIPWRDPSWGHCRMGSLTGAVHLSNDNAGVLRLAQGGQKPPVEQKGKCRLDSDFQYEYEPRKRGLSILLAILSLKQEVSEKLPQG